MPKPKKRIDRIEDLSFKLLKRVRSGGYGDWTDDGRITVRDDLTEFAQLMTGVHELVEMVACHLMGVMDKDMKPRYRQNPKQLRAHQFASRVEKELCDFAGFPHFYRNLKKSEAHRFRPRKV